MCRGITAVVFAVCLVSAVMVGCAGKEPKSLPEGTTPPVVTTPPKDAAVVVGGERVVARSMETPTWVREGVSAFKDKKPDCLYFMGISLPNEYEQKARESARQNAANEIASYISTSVNITNYFSDELQNSRGFVPIQGLLQRTVGKHVAQSVLRGQYEVALYTEKIERYENRVPVYYYQVKAIYEYPKSAVRAALEEAKREFEAQAQAMDLKERDEIKKELIDRGKRLLDAMVQQDYLEPNP